MMESRKLAAILSSLVSQLLLLLLHNIFPPNPPNPSSSDSILPLLLFSHQVAATLSLSSKHRKRKRKRDSQHHPNPLTRTPDSFRNSFMMSSSSFEWLSGLLEPLLECRDPADLFPLNLSSAVRLAIGLSRLAEGQTYPQISSRFSVSVPVAKFCVKQLCRVLCTNFRFWVSFPNPSDLPALSQAFQSLSGLPNCCGVVLCTRFNVVNANNTNNTSQVAAQIVVDSSFRILTIVAGFPGDKSDSQILKASTLFNDIQQGTLLNSPFNQYLIGDSQYPLLPWLMVPYVNPVPGSVEANFNSALETMRLPALRAASSLRNWGVLSRPVSEELKMAVAYIGACSILHNSLLMREDFSALASEFEDCKQSCNSEPCSTTLEGEAVSSKALALRDNLAAVANKIRDSKNS